MGAKQLWQLLPAVQILVQMLVTRSAFTQLMTPQSTSPPSPNFSRNFLGLSMCGHGPESPIPLGASGDRAFKSATTSCGLLLLCTLSHQRCQCCIVQCHITECTCIIHLIKCSTKFNLVELVALLLAGFDDALETLCGSINVSPYSSETFVSDKRSRAAVI